MPVPQGRTSNFFVYLFFDVFLALHYKPCKPLKAMKGLRRAGRENLSHRHITPGVFFPPWAYGPRGGKVSFRFEFYCPALRKGLEFDSILKLLPTDINAPHLG